MLKLYQHQRSNEINMSIETPAPEPFKLEKEIAKIRSEQIYQRFVLAGIVVLLLTILKAVLP